MKTLTRKTRINSLTAVLITLFICLLITFTGLPQNSFPEILSYNHGNDNNLDLVHSKDWLKYVEEQSHDTTGTLEVEPNEGSEEIVLKKISDIKHQVLESKEGKAYYPKEAPKLRDPHLYDASIDFQEIVNTSPLVLFIRSTDIFSLRTKSILLNEYETSPEIMVVDLTKHIHGVVLETYIKEKINADINTLSIQKIHQPPYLFLNGISVIENDFETNFMNLHKNNFLEDKIKSLSNKKLVFEKIIKPSNS